MKKFTKFKVDTNTYYQFHVIDYSSGESVSGGPVIAIFGDEELADEYCKFKNEQRDGKQNN